LGEIPDFTKLAEAYSLGGVKVVRPSELKDALQLALKSEGTFMVDTIIARESNILPMLPPAGSLDQFFGGCMENKTLLEIYPRVR
jgi:acetolactate synthase-1/2/3 large subunit